MRNTVDICVFSGICVAATLSQKNHCQPLRDILEQQEHLLSICSSFVVSKKTHLHVSLNKNVENKFKYTSQSFTNHVIMYQTFFTTMDVNFLMSPMTICSSLSSCRRITVFLLSLFFVMMNEAPGHVVVEGEPPMDHGFYISCR